MIDIRVCHSCHEIKPRAKFEPVKVGEEFVLDTFINGERKWRIMEFTDLLCSDCVSRIKLNSDYD